MQTMYAVLYSMHSLRRIGYNSSFGNDYLGTLSRNVKAIGNILDNYSLTQNIKNTKEMAHTQEIPYKLFIKSYVCFLINLPNTLKLFNNNTNGLKESSLKIFNNTGDYCTAVANDKFHLINKSIGTIAYK